MAKKEDKKNENKNEQKKTKEPKSTKNKVDKTKKEKKQRKESESERVEKQINKRFSKDSEVFKLIKIVLIVTAIMLVFYVITLVATDKANDVLDDDSSDTEENTETAIQYDYIMIGTMLNRGGSYYVLIEADEDPRIDEYTTLLQIISANEDAPKIYTANLTDSFNKNYLAKEANYTDDIADFRVTGTTLIRISDGHIGEVFDTHDEIKNRLNELAE